MTVSYCNERDPRRVQLVRMDLTKLQRKIVSTLITLDVHNRDIIQEFIETEVYQISDFGWQMQVRITRRAHKYSPVHRAGVNTAHLPRAAALLLG